MRAWRKCHHLTGEARVRATARQIAKTYLKRGFLIKKPCERCGTPRVEMHHQDYSKPLQVNWLCRSCHLVVHTTGEKLGPPTIAAQPEKSQGLTVWGVKRPWPYKKGGGCSKCGGKRDRKGAYCSVCHSAYERAYRARAAA